MTQIKHTPEPWKAFFNGFYHEIKVSEIPKGLDIHISSPSICSIFNNAEYQNTDGKMKANAERIISCVNAMEGIEEPAKLRETWEAVKHLELDAYYNCKAERDQLLAVLKEIIDHTTIDFAERNGFGPQRLKASEVYDRIQWPANETPQP